MLGCVVAPNSAGYSNLNWGAQNLTVAGGYPGIAPSYQEANNPTYLQQKLRQGDFIGGGVVMGGAGLILLAPEILPATPLVGPALARLLGIQGEQAANIVKNTERIPSLTNTASYRIPDFLDHASQVLGEVKNVQTLSFTNQLRDFSMYAQQKGYQFQLWVRPTTELTAPLQQQIQNGSILLRTLPPGPP